MRTTRLYLLVVALLTVSIPKMLPAQELSPPRNLDERITELEREVTLLKRLKEVDQDLQQRRDSETPWVIASQDGFTLKSKDNGFQIKFRGYIQADGRHFFEDDSVGTVDQFLVRRVRPILEGSLYKYTDFKFMPDFGSGSVSIQEAFLDFKYWKQASLRAGKFKSPIGFERLQSGTSTLFVERGLPTNLVPNRDIGVDLHGDFFEGALSYDLGVFNGVADSASSDSDNFDDKDIAGRIFTHPFKNKSNEFLRGLGFGISSSFGKSHGSTSSSQLPSYKTVGQNNFFTYNTGVFADGTRLRFSPQAYYYYGPLGLLGEYVFSNQEVRRVGVVAQDVTHTAWQVAGSYVLTGENASYNGIKPHDHFDPRNGMWGALELVGRFHTLSIDDQAFPLFANPALSAESALGYGLGLNWYLNRNVKWMLDFDQLFFNGGSGDLGGRESENALLSRLQVSF